MRNIKCFLLCFACVLLVSSCKKAKPDEPIPPVNEIDFNITYKVDNDAMVTNVNKFINQAGNHYSITKLEYYISQIKFIKPDSSAVLIKDYQYINAETASTNIIALKNIPAGNYIGISFNIGLDSLHNMDDILAPTVENTNMIWPVMMGGGYHFMKMEGYFIDSSGSSFGYAMHLGNNASLVPIALYKKIVIAVDSKFTLNGVMNINEWYRNPYTFDFNKDGNYIMGNAVLMNKIATNGKDVFSF